MLLNLAPLGSTAILHLALETSSLSTARHTTSTANYWPVGRHDHRDSTNSRWTSRSYLVNVTHHVHVSKHNTHTATHTHTHTHTHARAPLGPVSNSLSLGSTPNSLRSVAGDSSPLKRHSRSVRPSTPPPPPPPSPPISLPLSAVRAPEVVPAAAAAASVTSGWWRNPRAAYSRHKASLHSKRQRQHGRARQG